MIIIITYKDPKTGLIHVDYGIDTETDSHVVLPNNLLQDLRPYGLSFNQEIGEYTIP